MFILIDQKRAKFLVILSILFLVFMSSSLFQIIDNVGWFGPYSVTIVIFFLFMCIGLWSALSRQHLSYLIRGPAATKLFLGVRIEGQYLPASHNHGGLLAHIVDLNLDHVIFIAPVFIPKGEKLTMSFAAVPDIPAVVEPYTVKVVACRVLHAKPNTYLVKANFVNLAPALRVPLTSFVEDLARRRYLAPVH